MNRIRVAALCVMVLGATALLWTVAGCEKGSGAPRSPAVQTSAPTSSESGPMEVIAQSDTERAKAAIERERRARESQRRPFDPGSGPVVDQPRVGSGRR